MSEQSAREACRFDQPIAFVGSVTSDVYASFARSLIRLSDAAGGLTPGVP